LPTRLTPKLKALAVVIGLYAGGVLLLTVVAFVFDLGEASRIERLYYMPMIVAGLLASFGMWRLLPWSKYLAVVALASWYLPAAWFVLGIHPLGDFWISILGIALAYGCYRLFVALDRLSRPPA
jgi:hypothetical protein